jgi:hypothetical protein
MPSLYWHLKFHRPRLDPGLSEREKRVIYKTRDLNWPAADTKVLKNTRGGGMVQVVQCLLSQGSEFKPQYSKEKTCLKVLRKQNNLSMQVSKWTYPCLFEVTGKNVCVLPLR